MRITGKQPIKPTPSGDLFILPIEADHPEGDQERDEESVSDTQDYQLGTREFRDALVADNDDRAPAPEATREAREAHEDAISEQDQKVRPQPKPRAKTQRPSKAK